METEGRTLQGREKYKERKCEKLSTGGASSGQSPIGIK
jgi:hypothetical protein